MAWFRRPQAKRKPGTLTKSVWLSPKEVHYRLALERAELDASRIPFDEYYSALCEIVEKRDDISKWMLAALFALFLFKIRALIEFELPIVTVNPSVLGHIIFLAYAVSGLIFSSLQARIYQYQSVFEAAMDRSTGHDKQHMLLKYPKAYNVLLYHSWVSARPKYMHPKADWPVRMVIALLALLFFLVATLVFCAWIILSVTIELWQADAPGVGPWGRTLVGSSWAILIFSLLLPTISFRKIEFEHYGLVELLGRLQGRDPDRHRYYSALIGHTEHVRTTFKSEGQTRGD